MKLIYRPVLVVAVVLFLSNVVFAEDSSKTEEAVEHTGLEAIMEKTDKMVKESVDGSVMGRGDETGNFALFKDAKFHVRGDLQINGVHYTERDVNGYNGNDKVWDPEREMDVRIETNQVEAWFYHDLFLRPRIEFMGGMVNFHMELYNGGYMWEMDYPDVVDIQDVHGRGFTQATADYQKIEMRALFLEVFTPFGLIAAGKLPDSYYGLNGLMYAMPLPPAPQWTLGLMYGKKAESYYNKYVDEHLEGVNYWDTINQDSYVDNDDATYWIGLASYDDGEAMAGALAGVNVRGGASAPGWTNTDVWVFAGNLDYRKNRLHLYFSGQTRSGVITQTSTNEAGQDIATLSNAINGLVPILGNVQGVTWGPVDMQYPLGVAIWGLAQYDVGRFTPEIGLMYATGGEKWNEASQNFSRTFEPEGNRTPRENVKAYLLNEIEDKYYPLVSTFAWWIGPRDTEVFSYQNMSLVKLGSTYNISEHFRFFGQALAAWRTAVDYYETDYWDTFAVTYVRGKSKVYDVDGTKTTELPVLFEYDDIDYHETFDPFLGYEFNGKLSWLVRKGMEISLIGAYFKTGGFYEDLLTSKPYRQVLAIVPEGGDPQLEDKPDVWGPNVTDYGGNYERADAWTLQLKFDFKWQ